MKQKIFHPRNIANKEVAGICGVARMADKTLAVHNGKNSTYKYGVDSKQDTKFYLFLGISADSFQEAAIRINSDIRLGAWVFDNCSRSDEEISAFNRQLLSWWQRNASYNYLSKRSSELATKSESQSSFWGWLMTAIFFLELFFGVLL